MTSIFRKLATALMAVGAMSTAQAQQAPAAIEVAHDMAVTRMVQAGAVPITWMQLLLEYQRDGARQSTCDATVKIAIEHGGAYGTGLEYAKAMLGADAGEGKASKK